MLLNKNQSKELLLLLLKTFCLILGLNIFLTSFIIIVKEEFDKNKLESEIIFNIKELKYYQNVQIDKDIY